MKPIQDSEKNEMIVLDVASKFGWKVVHNDHLGIQIERRRKYPSSTLLIGCILCIVLIGILIILIGFAEYLSKRSEYLYIPKIRLTDDKLEDIIKQLE